MWNAVLRTDRRNQVKQGEPEFPVHKDSFFFNFCKNELEYRLAVRSVCRRRKLSGICSMMVQHPKSYSIGGRQKTKLPDYLGFP